MGTLRSTEPWSVGYDHIAEGAKECKEQIEKEDVGNTKDGPMFLMLSLNESRELLHSGEFGLVVGL